MKTPKNTPKALKPYYCLHMFCDWFPLRQQTPKTFVTRPNTTAIIATIMATTKEKIWPLLWLSKDQFLSLLTPVCIHKQDVGYETRRVYDYEKDYQNGNRNTSGKIVTMTVTKTEKSGLWLRNQTNDTFISYIMSLATKVSTQTYF